MVKTKTTIGQGGRIMSLDQAVASARRLVEPYLKRGCSLSRELRRERRNEAKRD